MAEETLYSLPFWRLFHSLLRGSTEPAEVIRAREGLAWVSDNLAQLRAVCRDHELDLLNLLWKYFTTHKEGPSYAILKEMALAQEKSEGVQAALDEYESLKSQFTRHEAPDLDQVLKEKTEEFQLALLNATLNKARRIANGSEEDKRTKRVLSGPEDSIQWFLNQVRSGLIIPNLRSLGGDLKEVIGNAWDDYVKRKRESSRGMLVIPTGIKDLDAVIGGIRRQELVCVLGFAGQRKSSVCRSIAYRAAMAGFTTVHIGLEQTFSEERNIYLVMHSYHEKFADYGFEISRKALDDATLTPAEEDFLFRIVAKDYEENTPGAIILRQPTTTTWEEIKAQVEFEHKMRPVDMLLIDYLTLVSTTGSYNPKEKMEEVIKNAKQWAFTFGDGRGIAVLTPVQGNRDGYDRVRDDPDHRWDMSGVYMFSEFEKSADTVIYVYLDDELKKTNRLIMGTCKTRRSGDCPPFMLAVNPCSGQLREEDPDEKLTEEKHLTVEEMNAEIEALRPRAKV